MEHAFFRLDDVAEYELAPGVTGRPLLGEHMMVNVVELEPDADVALHSHPHEQIGLVLRGVMVMTIAGETRPVGPNEAFTIPGGVPHSGRAGPEGATVVDVFQPVREDYRERWEAARGEVASD
jgi:quercetin dioxygenase-like cupin family protein